MGLFDIFKKKKKVKNTKRRHKSSPAKARFDFAELKSNIENIQTSPWTLLCCPERHTGRECREWNGSLFRISGELWQAGHHTASERVENILRTFVKNCERHSEREQDTTGTGHRLCRVNRTRDRSSPSLRS